MATDTSTTNFVPPGFRTIEHLGVGTAFAVARVHDAQGRDLICKRAVDARFAAALDRERDVLALTTGASIPELVASGSDARGGFLVETRARGTAVRELMGGRTPPGAAQWLALACASTRALAALHAMRDPKGALRFVHGDVSPDNLFFEPPATVTFIDFSSSTWRDAPQPALTGDRGTVPYAAPELTRQEVHATAATDTYALAATLLAVAVGPPLVRATTEAGRLFETGSRGILWERIEERTDLPAEVRSALAEALQYEQVRRLTSCHDLAARLGAFASGATPRA
jgi:serine/threonine protein kinase